MLKLKDEIRLALQKREYELRTDAPEHGGVNIILYLTPEQVEEWKTLKEEYDDDEKYFWQLDTDDEPAVLYFIEYCES